MQSLLPTQFQIMTISTGKRNPICHSNVHSHFVRYSVSGVLMQAQHYGNIFNPSLKVLWGIKKKV